ncbi:2-polyprenyl-3-methyl-6-methoxy-1,4-benzoquinone monooxygenase [Fontimonas sp. SYSU GA230001]|uniref:2-polyprenyl-3-methyl-6-methoxy-1,4-benzoquinone monooxygenase n=1 Tax=Fontimonas sp. SYSU GA230001 TaxID=3142450 RepID=UPI0032B5778A
MSRHLSPTDHLLSALDRALSRLVDPARQDAARPSPAPGVADPAFDERTRAHVAGLMRVNHAGEVAAQALYRGQALVARDEATRRKLLDAAREEQDHLRWCEARLRELGDQPSRLQPLWYAGSFVIGAAAGLAGDAWSFGFVDETERQVSAHLGEHIGQLPPDDQRSRAILERMRADEERHGRAAREAGGRPLPEPVRQLMRQIARVMKFSAYRI